MIFEDGKGGASIYSRGAVLYLKPIIRVTPANAASTAPRVPQIAGMVDAAQETHVHDGLGRGGGAR